MSKQRIGRQRLRGSVWRRWWRGSCQVVTQCGSGKALLRLYHAALQLSDTSSRKSSIDSNTRERRDSATSSFRAEEDKIALKSGSPFMECKSCGARTETACSCDENVRIYTRVRAKFAKLPRKTARWMRALTVPLASRCMRARMPSELQQPESATAARLLRLRSALLPCDS
jgi:hypothetical protein